MEIVALLTELCCVRDFKNLICDGNRFNSVVYTRADTLLSSVEYEDKVLRGIVDVK
jgi:hypothetical protein